MAIYRGAGGAGDAVNDSSSEASAAVIAADAALAAKVAAEAARDAAQLSETNADASEANAASSATSASSAANAAHTYANNASNSAVSAANSATNAASSSTSAGVSATNAANSSTSAAGSASAAAVSATSASNSASSAAASATNAATSATSASTSASSASSSASTATTQASNASTSATNAASSASTANSAATTATTQAGIATTQATNASNSASAAATSATNAANSASTATTQASNASTSATAAQSAQTAAEAARDATLAAYDSFDDRYLGTKTSDPSVDNDGNSLVAGALYFNSVDGVMKLWTGSIWTAAYVSGAGVLLQANNLSDLNNVSSARTNLGLGTAATTDSTAYATATQGATADTAYADRLKWDGGATGLVAATGRTSLGVTATGADTTYAYRANNLSDLASASTARTNLGLGTAATTAATDYATAAQGAKADTALQPAAIGVSVQGYDANTAKLNAAQSWSAAQSFNAGVTLGDASGDALTINSSAVSIPNGLNFDSNTFVIDATNNRVGVGTASPASTIEASVDSSSGNGAVLRLSNRSSAVSAGVSSGEIEFYKGDLSGGAGVVSFIKSIPIDLGANYDITFGTGSSTSVSERMRITYTGNVGIGTSSPSAKLEVTGGTVVRGSTTGTQASITTATSSLSVITGTSYNATPSADFVLGSSNWDAVNNNSAFQWVMRPTGTAGGYSLSFNTRSFDGTSTYTLTERMAITAAGNVGIGTSNPSALLHVSNASAKIRIGVDASSQYTDIFRDNATGYTVYNAAQAATFRGHIWQLGGSEAMRIDSSGNVGIGTSSPSSFGELTVTQTSGSTVFQLNTTTNGVGTYVVATNSAGVDNWTYGGYVNYGTTTASPIVFNTNSSERMRIDSSGNVGIGGSTPTAKLDVYKNATVSSTDPFGSNVPTIQGKATSASGKAMLQLTALSSNSAPALAYVEVGAITDYRSYMNSVYSADSSGAGYFSVSQFNPIGGTTTERMRIDSSGNVGIGTSSPGTRLTITTSSGGSQASFFNGTYDAYVGIDSGFAGLDLATGSGIRFRTGVSYTERMRISSTGGLSVGTTADPGAGAIYATGNITAYYSDERLKTKIGNIDNALDKVKQIETMVYHANDKAVELGYDASVIEVGVTAQSVQKVQPEVVVPAPVDQQYLTVRYDRLVPLLIEAIKELEAQVAELKAK